MLTLGTRIKLIIFVVLSVLVVGYIGATYADLGRDVGVGRDYTVRLELPSTGGLFAGSDVTYRGVSVGRVGALDLSPDGVVARLRLRSGGPRIPADLDAVVADRSAVGEQYVDLRPRGSAGPYLAGGSVIPRTAATVPVPVAATLKSLNDFTTSIPLADLQTLVTELGMAFTGQGPHLQQLLDTGHTFIQASDENFPQTQGLIHNGDVALATQVDEAAAFASFAGNTRLLAARLRASDADFRRLIQVTPGASETLSTLLRSLDPSLSKVLANLLTGARLSSTRTAGIEQVLAQLPAVASVGATVAASGRLRIGIVNTFFNPQPCTRGSTTKYRNGLDTTSAPFNTGAYCAERPSTGIDVRGAANEPHGGVPAPGIPSQIPAGNLLSLVGGAPSAGRNLNPLFYAITGETAS